MTDTPSIVVVFFGNEKTLRVKYEGAEEILKGMDRLFISDINNDAFFMGKRGMEFNSSYDHLVHTVCAEFQWEGGSFLLKVGEANLLVGGGTLVIYTIVQKNYCYSNR